MKDVWTWHEHVIRWHAAHGLLYTINLGLHVQPLSVIKRRGESMLVFTETDFSRRCVIRHIGNLQTWHHDAHFVIATNISWGHCPLSQSCGHVPLLPPRSRVSVSWWTDLRQRWTNLNNEKQLVIILSRRLDGYIIHSLANPFNARFSKLLLFERFSAIRVYPTIFSSWHSGALTFSPGHQSARMSKIKNGGLDQCDKV